MKLKDAKYKSHQIILVFCDQRKIMSDLNMSHEKMSDFVTFPLFGFIIVIKLRNLKNLQISCREYSLIINKHNQKLTSIMENQR